MMKVLLSIATIILFAIQLQAQNEIPEEVNKLLDKNTCNACHKLDQRLIGPSYNALAAKGHSVEKTVELIYNPKPENWPGYPPMAAMPHLDEKEVEKIAEWIVSLDETEE